jgi:leucyl aminopeptidase (aminopeptidase T)
MSFDTFMTERLRLVKADGTVVDDIPASVQKKIYINDVKVPVEEGDILEFELLSGIKRRLLVTDMVVYAMGSQLDHMELTFVKD